MGPSKTVKGYRKSSFLVVVVVVVVVIGFLVSKKPLGYDNRSADNDNERHPLNSKYAPGPCPGHTSSTVFLFLARSSHSPPILRPSGYISIRAIPSADTVSPPLSQAAG